MPVALNQQKGPSFLFRFSSGQGLPVPLLDPTSQADWSYWGPRRLEKR